MGFSLTGSHVIFFIASLIVAGTVSGIFVAVTMDVSKSLNERGGRVQEQLDTDFEIINDPTSIPSYGVSYYIFYLKNIGGRTLITTNETFELFDNGQIIAKASYYFSPTSCTVSSVTNIYVLQTAIAAGDHKLRVVGPMAIEDEFTFTI